MPLPAGTLSTTSSYVMDIVGAFDHPLTTTFYWSEVFAPACFLVPIAVCGQSVKGGTTNDFGLARPAMPRSKDIAAATAAKPFSPD